MSVASSITTISLIVQPDEDAMPPNFKFLRKMSKIADGSSSDIQLPTDDVTFERKSRDLVRLYQVSDESGTLTITEVGGYPLKRELLDSKVQVFIHKAHILLKCHGRRMLSFWTLGLEASLLGLEVELHDRKRRLPSRMLLYVVL